MPVCHGWVMAMTIPDQYQVKYTNKWGTLLQQTIARFRNYTSTDTGLSGKVVFMDQFGLLDFDEKTSRLGKTVLDEAPTDRRSMRPRIFTKAIRADRRGKWERRPAGGDAQRGSRYCRYGNQGPAGSLFPAAPGRFDTVGGSPAAPVRKRSCPRNRVEVRGICRQIALWKLRLRSTEKANANI